MKKLLVGIIAILCLVGGTNAFASSGEYVDNDGDVVKQSVQTNGNVVVETSSFAVSEGGFGILSGAYYHAYLNIGKTWSGGIQMKYYVTGQSKAYTDSSETTFKAITKIGVISRLYEGTAILDTATETLDNSSIAAATAWQQNWSYDWSGESGNSNHTFELTGYQGYYPTLEVEY